MFGLEPETWKIVWVSLLSWFVFMLGWRLLMKMIG